MKIMCLLPMSLCNLLASAVRLPLLEADLWSAAPSWEQILLASVLTAGLEAILPVLYVMKGNGV